MDVFLAVKQLETLFNKKGFSLYYVGGTVRDFLLDEKITDVDLATNALPSDMREILESADFTFEKFGYVKAKFNDFYFDITTLRIEDEYDDFRHPKKIVFTEKLEEDCQRRDFTINGLYMDTSFHIYDYVNGVNDLKNKILKMIGDPIKRISEDPLRIIRALRFSLSYKLTISYDLKMAILKQNELLESLNIEKIKQDIHKIKNSSKEEIYKLFFDFGIQKYLDVIK